MRGTEFTLSLFHFAATGLECELSIKMVVGMDALDGSNGRDAACPVSRRETWKRSKRLHLDYFLALKSSDAEFMQ